MQVLNLADLYLFPLVLLLQIAMAEPFQSSPSFVPVVEKGFEPDISSNSFKGRMQGLSQSSPLRSSSNERDKTGNNSNLARIRVVVGFLQLPVIVCLQLVEKLLQQLCYFLRFVGQTSMFMAYMNFEI